MNHNFKDLFGLETTKIKNNCILVPFYFPHMLELFEIESWKKGQCFASGNNQDFTLIHTRMGASFVGDAVLYLNETGCKNLFFLGSCGLVKKTSSLDIGSLVVANKAYALESFTDLLLNGGDFSKSIVADNNFLNGLIGQTEKPVTVASLGSITLETTMINAFIENNIDVVDMETAAFLHAAKHIDRNAAAFLFVTDILNETSPFSYSPEHKNKIVSARSTAAHILMKRCRILA